MRTIKKYSNQKFYDTSEKKYISIEKIEELVKSGEEIAIVENRTGKDITGSVLSKTCSQKNHKNDFSEDESILIAFVKKTGESIEEFVRKYSPALENAFSMAENEIDNIIKYLVKNDKLSDNEGLKLKKEFLDYIDQIKKWIVDNIDQRVKDILSVMNLATKEQIQNLTTNIEELSKKVDKLYDASIAQQNVEEAPKLELKEE
ncbi:MAG: hypothetical protein HQK76_01610 [Desulfobacterales bacterium]|nr:hypothetical protein [Desulfobacterales bacterium]